MGHNEMFEVQVNSDRCSPFVGGGRQIVFHGVNKSGSLVLSDVLRSGYNAAGREGEFHSHYHKTVGSIEELVGLADGGRVGGIFIAHYLWGALRAMPSRVFITQFRHPLPRVVSCYQWLKNKHEKRVRLGESSVEFPSLPQFVKETEGKKHSQVSQFCAGFGEHARIINGELSARQMLPIAKDSIHRGIHSIGIAEHFEETLFMFSYLCGIKAIPAWKRDERNLGRPLVSELESEDVAIIREVYDADFQLYEWAVERFKEQMEQYEMGPSLAAYKASCAAEYKDRLQL